MKLYIHRALGTAYRKATEQVLHTVASGVTFVDTAEGADVVIDKPLGLTEVLRLIGEKSQKQKEE